MTEQEYLDTRLDNQLKYYSTKCRKNQKLYQSFKIIEIAIAVTIPFLTGYIGDNNLYIKYLIGTLGVLLALISGIQVLLRFQSKWINFRSTAESLKQEKFMFLTKAGPYRIDATLSNLAERVETILAKENSTWNQLMNTKEQIYKNN